MKGDCLKLLSAYRGRRLSAVITDPPGAKGMAKWDSLRGGVDAWIHWLAQRLEALRGICEPGAWLVCWAHPSTSWMTGCAIHRAGFLIEDKIALLNGQGRAPSRKRLAPGHEDWWLACAPGPRRALQLDLPAVVGTRRRHPRNVLVHPESPVAQRISAEGGTRKTGDHPGIRHSDKHRNTYSSFRGTANEKPAKGDAGSVLRYFPQLGHGDLALYGPRARHSERLLPSGKETKHPTAKSPEVMRWFVKLLDLSPGSLIGDPFCGSGAVLEAALSLGHDGWGCDLDKRWVAETLDRLSAYPISSTAVASPSVKSAVTGDHVK